MSKFRGNRVTKRQSVKVAAKPEAIFPLLCPERELEWIDGWNYEMIYSQSGLAELGCTFKTHHESDTYWMMTKHLQPCEAEYIQFVVGLMFISLNIRLSKIDDGTTMEITFTYTGVTEAGNQYIANQAELQSEHVINMLEKSLNHFLTTGQKLQRHLA